MSNDIDELDELEALASLAEDEPVAKPSQTFVTKTVVEEPDEDEEEELEDGEIVIVNPIGEGADLQDILSFDDIDIAVRGQAGLYAYYSECAARGQKQYNRSKQNLEQVEARVSHTLRGNWDATKNGKITEKALDARVRLSSAYRRAQECLNDALYIYKLSTSVAEAFHQREQMLIQTCKRAEIEIMTTGGLKSRFSSKEDRDDKVRDALKKRSTAHD